MAKLLVVIPAFNEEKMIGKVISAIPQKIVGIKKTQILVVNDGSEDKTEKEVLKFNNVFVVDHLLNRGVGASWLTGFSYAKKFGFDIILTMDADGQHNPSEIPRLIRPILSGSADVVLGSRLKFGVMPPDRRVLNLIANFYTYLLFGIYVSDSQSGFRAYSRKAFSQIDVSSSRMEAASEILAEVAKKKLKLREVAVTSIYTKYSREKGQKNLNAINIGAKLFLRFLTS